MRFLLEYPRIGQSCPLVLQRLKLLLNFCVFVSKLLKIRSFSFENF